MHEVYVDVKRGDHRYGIFFDSFLPDRWRDEIEARVASDRYFAVFDHNAATLHGLDRPGSERKGWTHLRLGAGEEHKTLASVAELCERILALRPDRRSVVVAVGGGVVGDMGGFAASMLLRGLRFVQVPTTLLAQVDSSVGGKTGVNMAGGKNLIGAFHQPELVLVDPAFLKTLPEREYLSGLAETIKYGLIGDRAFFQSLTAEAERLARRDPELLAEVTAHCCRMKAEIVGADETEKGRRGLLNLGHTFGHALEALGGYDGSVNHGEAVAVGMALAASFAVERGMLSSSEAELARDGLRRLGLPTRIGELRLRDFPKRPEEEEQLRGVLLKDKKAAAAKLTLVLPAAVGDCRLVHGVSAGDVAAFMLREA